MYTGGEEDFWNEELTQSVDRYEEMLKASADLYFDIHELEGIFDYYFNQKKFRAARQLLSHGFRIHPDSPALKLKETQVLIERGNPTKALELLKVLEPINENNEQVYLIKGSAFLMLDDVDQAVEAYQKALEISDEPDEWVLNISFTFQKLGKFDHAINFLKDALVKDPKNLDLNWELAVCLEQSGQDEEAINTYQLFLELDPFSDAGWFNIGVLLNHLNDFDKAIDAFEYVLAISPDFHSALFNKGNALANQGKHLEAIDIYNEYLDTQDSHPQTLCYIGESYEKLNSSEKAFQYFKKARSIDPTYSEAWYGLAGLMKKQGNLYEAMFYIRKAMQLKKGNPDFLFLAGEIYDGLEFYEEAVDYFEKVIKIDSDDPEAAQMLEKIKAKLKDES